MNLGKTILTFDSLESFLMDIYYDKVGYVYTRVRIYREINTILSPIENALVLYWLK